MKKIYIKPQSHIVFAMPTTILCGSGTTDSASIGGEGSPNEKNQDDISTGGPGVAGVPKRPWYDFDEE
ncbi:MAG: hypothetical protein ACTTKJ_09415 [Prevotella koreensis]|uniref:hypothetical protein n=1 Tax=Prevotella koreensis TaxID=2490854 RepID=UPI003F9FE33D